MVIEASGIDIVQIARVSSLVSDLARRDVSGLSHGDLLEAHDAVARLGRLTGTLQSRFAGEIARRSAPDQPGGGLARQQGFGNAGTMISRATGGSTAAAMRSIEAGRALMPEMGSAADPLGACATPASAAHAPRYPAVAEASLAGDLSVDAAGLITAGLETIAGRVPSYTVHLLERCLVEKALNLAAQEVRRMVATAVARADLRGNEEREQRQHADRYLAWKEDHTGMVTFAGKLDAVTAAPIRTAIEQMVTHAFRSRRDQDPAEKDQRTVGQMRADALFELCRHALGCKETDRSGIRTAIVVRMNLRDLGSGRGLGRIDGTEQPVSVGQLRRLAGDAGIVPEVLGGESEVLDVGRTARLFTREQRLALVERDGGCAKCHAPPEHCEAHHIRWWETGGGTDLANGVMLCTRCHHDVHRQGWEIVVQGGHVDFIPPPQVDPQRRAIPGGLAAIEVGVVGGGSELGTLSSGADQPWDDSAWEDPAWEDPAWEDSAWENSAWDGLLPRTDLGRV